MSTQRPIIIAMAFAIISVTLVYMFVQRVKAQEVTDVHDIELYLGGERVDPVTGQPLPDAIGNEDMTVIDAGDKYIIVINKEMFPE